MSESTDLILHNGLQGGVDEKSLLFIVINHLRTGNIFIDMIMVSLFSSIISFIFYNLQKIDLGRIFTWLWRYIRNFIWPPIKPKPEPVFNSLEIPYSKFYCQTGSTLYSLKNESFDEGNEKIHEAIYDFIHSFVVDNTKSELGLKLKEGRSISETIRSSSFRVRPLDTIVFNGFHILFSSQELTGLSKDSEQQQNSKNQKTTFNTKQMITIKSQKSLGEIRDFVEEIYRDWVEKYYPEESSTTKRYYLVLKDASRLEFQGLPMTTEVTFNDIFFPKKKLLMKRIKDYMSGHIKIPKFVILLHGRPGGGKTSFIKALYNMTKCHVININLNDFKNFDDLFRLFHEESIRISEDPSDAIYHKVKIPIKERIYLFEDIDAQDNLVHQRKGEEKNVATKVNTMTNGTADVNNATKTTNDATNDKNKTKNQDQTDHKDKKGETENKNKSKTNDGYDSSNDENEADNNENNKKEKDHELNKKEDVDLNNDDEEEEEDSDSDPDQGFGLMSWQQGGKANFLGSGWRGPIEERSNLTLSKILNLLDGVKELNKPFIVLTTNHYNKLDAALVRPGRITWSQELKPIRIKDMKNVIKKFLREAFVYDPIGDISESETEAVSNKDQSQIEKYELLDKLLLELEMQECMPGLFESLCIHEYDLDGVIRNVENHLKETRNKFAEYQEKIRKKKARTERRRLLKEKREDDRLTRLLKNVPELATTASNTLTSALAPGRFH